MREDDRGDLLDVVGQDVVATGEGSMGPAGPQQATRDSVSRIVITSGPKAGLELPLTGEPLTIGRSSESGLVIRDDYTSSHHARLLLWGDQWMLQDLDSTNGTWMGGQRVGTLVIYLNTPVAGGSTIFPDIGLDVSWRAAWVGGAE